MPFIVHVFDNQTLGIKFLFEVFFFRKNLWNFLSRYGEPYYGAISMRVHCTVLLSGEAQYACFLEGFLISVVIMTVCRVYIIAHLKYLLHRVISLVFVRIFKCSEFSKLGMLIACG